MSTDAREYMKTTLPPLLAAGWDFIAYQRIPETLSRITVALKVKAFEPAPVAPIGSLMVETTITVASPLTDTDKAEEQLDDAVRALCSALDGLDRAEWTRAEKVSTKEDGGYLGWDITLNIREDKE